MKRLIAIAAVLSLAACAESPTAVAPAELEASFAVGGNPHWVTTQTACGLSGSAVNCLLKAAGLGSGRTLLATVTVDATVTITCTNPAGRAVPGWTGRTRVGTGSGSFGPATRNGQVSGVIRDVVVNFSGPNGCPSGNWTATQRLAEYSWELTGTVDGVSLPARSGSF